jgi:rhodanese-related sulfurtransferase
LNLLRLKSRNLSTDQRYLIYCNTGNRAQAAECLLQQQNLNCMALKSGSNSIAVDKKAIMWINKIIFLKMETWF